MGLRSRDWRIGPVEHDRARAFIELTHYSRSAPNTSVARHGLYLASSGILSGVAMWLPPTKPAAVSADPDNWRGVLSLSRLAVAPWVPRNGASFLLGRSMRALDRGRWPTLLTYADTALGHTGSIYLATNWERVGEVAGSDNWLSPAGERHGRKRGGRNYSAAEMRDMGYVKLPPMPKIKFVHRVP